MPPVELIPKIAIDAFTITMVTYTISMSMALIFAAKEKYEVDANQELLALVRTSYFSLLILERLRNLPFSFRIQKLQFAADFDVRADFYSLL